MIQIGGLVASVTFFTAAVVPALGVGVSGYEDPDSPTPQAGFSASIFSPLRLPATRSR